MIYFGVDPGVEASAVAGVNDHNQLVVASMFSTNMKGNAGVIDQARKVAEFFRRLVAEKVNAAELMSAVAAIESQEIAYTAKAGKNPRSMMPTARVSGIYVLAFAEIRSTIYLPQPAAWKGQVPKQIHHARICERMGWRHEVKGTADPYCVPHSLDPEKHRILSDILIANGGYSCWKHLMDAVGLALWVKEQHTKQAFKRTVLGK